MVGARITISRDVTDDRPSLAAEGEITKEMQAFQQEASPSRPCVKMTTGRPTPQKFGDIRIP